MAGMAIRIAPYNTHKRIGLQKWDRGFRAFLREESEVIASQFTIAARGFVNHRVTVKKKVPRKSGGNLDVIVGVLDKTPGNTIFSYVNWGTKPRMIYPVNSKYLIFKIGYKPATKRGTIQVHPPWQKVGSYVYFNFVKHPGIADRRFDKVVQYIMERLIEIDGQKAVAELAGVTWRA